MVSAPQAQAKSPRGATTRLRRDKAPKVFVAIYDATETKPDPDRLKDHAQAKDIALEADDTFVSLVTFKNYWDNTSDLVAYRLFSPAAIDGIYTHAPNPLYLLAINEELFKRARKIAHEIGTFWAIKQAYGTAEQLISNNGFNVRHTFQTESAIAPLTDYGRFLKIWSQDYALWREHVEHFLTEITYRASSL